MMLLELGAKVFVGAVEQQQKTTTNNKQANFPWKVSHRLYMAFKSVSQFD